VCADLLLAALAWAGANKERAPLCVCVCVCACVEWRRKEGRRHPP
jgi:hypothetical protein